MEQPRVDTRNVRSLRPLRVLVAARDERFNRVAGFLLARRGFDVEILRRPSAVLDTVSPTGIDVVIVDASDSVSDAARAVAAPRSSSVSPTSANEPSRRFIHTSPLSSSSTIPLTRTAALYEFFQNGHRSRHS